MLKKATLICPRCKEAMPDVTIKNEAPFPNKCDKCGSTNVMVTHLLTGILEPGEIEAQKRKREAIEKASKQAAEGLAATLLKV